MENYNAKAIVNKYRLQVQLIITVLGVISIILILTNISIIKSIIVLLLFSVARETIHRYLYDKHVISALSVELDPVKFKAILDAGELISLHALEQISAAYHNQDHQAVVDICTFKLHDEKCTKYKYSYLTYLARVYFDLGDHQKLRAVCDSFEESVRSAKKPEQLRSKYPFMQFCCLYLNGDFSACKTHYEKLLKDKRFMSTQWTEIYTRYSYAITCYKCGDFKNAEQHFHYVVRTAPKLHLAGIAQKYLDAMESGTEYVPEHAQITPTKGFSLPLWEKIKKKRRNGRIIASCIALAAAVLLLLYICPLIYGSQP